MTHEYMPKGRIVYKEGETSHNFYIILLGTAAVFISNKPNNKISLVGMKKFKPLAPKCFTNANSLLQNKYEFMKMKTGDAFGETAIMQDKPLTESILCTTNCHFAVLSKHDFENTLMTIEMKTRQEWKSFFRSHHIFEKLTLASLEKLFYVVELNTYFRNQPIFKQGEEIKGFYLIYQGDVRKSKKIQDKYTEKLDINKFLTKKNIIEQGKIYHIC